MNIIFVQGDLTDVSAVTKALVFSAESNPWKQEIQLELPKELQIWWCIALQLYRIHMDIGNSENYRITSKYSNALRTSQTCNFAKCYHTLHAKVAFEAPWSCARYGIK